MRHVWCLAVLLSASCRQSPSTTVNTPALPTHTFGDTTEYVSHILQFDVQKEQVVVDFKSRSYVVVLAVIPGKSIEQISPVPGRRSGRFSSGKRTLDLRQPQNGADPIGQEMNSAELGEVNRCVVAATAAARRQAQAKARPVRRDSLGRIIEDRSPPPETAIDDTRFESACRAQVRSRSKNRPQPKMPIREPAERYLVVLTSPYPMEGPMISDRLETLITMAPDVATTIEAIAQGLFAGKDATWSGTFISWE